MVVETCFPNCAPIIDGSENCQALKERANFTRGFVISLMLSGFQDSRIPGFQDSRIPGFQDSRIPGFLENQIRFRHSAASFYQRR
jgi:hypothetical protein